MSKGYWIASGDVSDPEAYEKYKAANAIPFAKYGAKFLVRGGAQTGKEGAWRTRTVVIEFPSYEDALACYESPEYQAAKTLRVDISDSDLVITAGFNA